MNTKDKQETGSETGGLLFAEIMKYGNQLLRGNEYHEETVHSHLRRSLGSGVHKMNNTN